MRGGGEHIGPRRDDVNEASPVTGIAQNGRTTTMTTMINIRTVGTSFIIR